MDDANDIFTFDARQSDSPLVEFIWRTQSERPGAFMSSANSHWEMVVTKYQGTASLTVRGPETKASPAPIPENAEFFGMVFKLGTFMPHLPATNLVNGAITLPEAAHQSFWLNCSTWQLPDFDNADTFIHRLVREGLLAHDSIVHAALNEHAQELSLRTVQRRFLQATGMTYKTIQQIERAHAAMTLLQQGVPILDAVYETGYSDQSHLTNSLKRFMGKTPAQITQIRLSDAIYPASGINNAQTE